MRKFFLFLLNIIFDSDFSIFLIPDHEIDNRLHSHGEKSMKNVIIVGKSQVYQSLRNSLWFARKCIFLKILSSGVMLYIFKGQTHCLHVLTLRLPQFG